MVDQVELKPLEFRPDDKGQFDEIVARFADGMVHVETLSNQGCYVGFYWDDGRYCQWWIGCTGRGKLTYNHEDGIDDQQKYPKGYGTAYNPVEVDQVEKVARAIEDVIWPLADWDGDRRVAADAAQQAARAAIAAYNPMEGDQVELLPCPFCGFAGGDYVGLTHVQTYGQNHYRIRCGQCRATTGSHPTDEAACAAWNTRTAYNPNKRLREAYEAQLVETQMNAFKWMEAHDKLKAGRPYDLPTPADLPEALARVERLREALEGGTISQTSFDGYAVRIDFETREEANTLFAALIS